MRTIAVKESKLSLGYSKIGGLPDLPEGWMYPLFDGKPLAFLAQVNLAEIPTAIQRDPLPSIGIMYFFSVFGWQQEDGDHHPDLSWERCNEPGFSQVLYFEGDSATLTPAAKPVGIKVFKAAPVRFVEVLSLPRASDYARDPVLDDLDWPEEEFERFTDLYFDFSFVLRRKIGSTPNHKLLGYPDPIQTTITQSGSRLLCQIDSDYHNLDTDMMWGDGGMIYFTIDYSDLERREFSTVHSDMQSG
jgi:uncharacterized protein YwqG